MCVVQTFPVCPADGVGFVACAQWVVEGAAREAEGEEEEGSYGYAQ